MSIFAKIYITMVFNITLPNRTGTNQTEVITTESNMVFVGANGSGKTRLSVWVEKKMT